MSINLHKLSCPIPGKLLEKIGYSFARPDLLELALTHSSFANEGPTPGRHNERLEFLGDAALELCVSAELFRRFPKAREGVLTQMRSSLVSERSLAALARQLDLPLWLKLGAGEERQGGRGRDSILADALEALLGAVYLDGGLAGVEGVVGVIFARAWPNDTPQKQDKDFKSRLQEYCVHAFQDFPIYALEKMTGSDHAKSFAVCLTLPNGRQFCATNSSRRLAEQNAAELALASIAETQPLK